MQSKQRNTIEQGLHGEALVLAEEITRYIQESGFVADTLDGICSWWLVRERLREERLRVESAVRILCQRGVIEQRQLADGTTLYLAAEKLKNRRGQ